VGEPIRAVPGESVLLHTTESWNKLETYTFLVVQRGTASRVTTEDGRVWDRATGRRIPAKEGGEVRDVVPGDHEKAAAAQRRREIHHALWRAEKLKAYLTDEEIAALHPVMISIVPRLEAVERKREEAEKARRAEAQAWHDTRPR
jgi:hypothetical protein